MIPLDWMELYTHALDAKGQVTETPRWKVAHSVGTQYGFKFHNAGIILHSLIPLQDIITTQAGTPVEQTAPNLQPFMEIFKDTNYTSCVLKFAPEATGLVKHLENPQKVILSAANTAPNPETIINTFGHMDTMKAGERKAFTATFRDEAWYIYELNEHGTRKYPVNYLPQWGGTRGWICPNCTANTVANHMNRDQTSPIFLRMTPVKDSTGAYI